MTTGGSDRAGAWVRFTRGPHRRWIISALVVLATGAIVASVALWGPGGWWAMLTGLVLIGAGLMLASSAPGSHRRYRLLAGGLVAVLVVAGGLNAVRLEPWRTPGWHVGPDDDLVARAGTVAVTLDPRGTLQGWQAQTGEQIWQIPDTELSLDTHWATGDGAELIFWSLLLDLPGDQRVVLLDAERGELRWTADPGRGLTLGRVTEDVLVFTLSTFGGYEREVLALDRTDGSEVWRTDGSLAMNSRGLDRNSDAEAVGWFQLIHGADYALIEHHEAAAELTLVELATGAEHLTLPDPGTDRQDYELIDDVVIHLEPTGAELGVSAQSVAGEALWRATLSTPGLLFYAAVDGHLRVVDQQGYWIIDPTTGAEQRHAWPDGALAPSPQRSHYGSPWLALRRDEGGPLLFNTSTAASITLDRRFPLVDRLGVHGTMKSDVPPPQPQAASGHVYDHFGRFHAVNLALGDDGHGDLLVSDRMGRLTDGLLQIGDRVVPLPEPEP